jgi:hypothetical protein
MVGIRPLQENGRGGQECLEAALGAKLLLHQATKGHQWFNLDQLPIRSVIKLISIPISVFMCWLDKILQIFFSTSSNILQFNKYIWGNYKTSHVLNVNAENCSLF